jgi:hypothetical protein
MIRSQSEAAILNNLSGIKETEPVIDDRLDELHGAFDNPMGSLHRTMGKLLTTVDTVSSVWSIRQLRFREGPVVVERAGPVLGGTNQFGIRPPYVPLSDGLPDDDPRRIVIGPERYEKPPMPPFPDEPHREDADIPPVSQQIIPDAPSYFPYDDWTLVLELEPASLTFNLTDGGGVEVKPFTAEVRYKQGFIPMRMTGWAAGASGVAVRRTFSGSLVGDNENVWYLFDATNREAFTLEVNSDTVPYGTTTFNLVATLTQLHGADLILPSGDKVTDTMAVTIIKLGDPKMGISPTSGALTVVSGDTANMSIQFTMTNTGSGVLTWQFNTKTGDAALTDILSVSPSGGTLTESANEPVTLTLTAPGALAVGSYYAIINFKDTNLPAVTGDYTLALSVLEPVPATCPYTANRTVRLAGADTDKWGNLTPLPVPPDTGDRNQSVNWCRWVLGGIYATDGIFLERISAPPSGNVEGSSTPWATALADVKMPCWLAFFRRAGGSDTHSITQIAVKTTGSDPVGAYTDIGWTKPSTITVSEPT